MLIGSFLLLLVGAVLLISGLMAGNDSLLVGAIVASLIAAVCLYASSRRPGARQSAHSASRHDAGHSKSGDDDDTRLRDRGGDQTEVMARESELPRHRRSLDEPIEEELRRERDSRERDAEPQLEEPEQFDVEVSDGSPSDEPSEVPMSSVEAAALMRMDAEVMVVDGRPRFHLGGCVHVVGRDAEPLPAYEAVELGFTACALCRPAQSLLGEPAPR